MPLPLYYTFGNHMHWVDMQWLWGYDVLPGSVRDMIALCREAGVKGNVNFDAIGYEKMAAECPEALAELKAAVQEGLIEPVGCSYGQPYGLFHGGESNIRQLNYGVRATMRHLGVRPRTFWEEEFYFFPQLPQLLASAGYTGACLFFQWTWHTPELPKEPHSLILWQGIDGTTLPTLPRNSLNVHQWPEDFDGLCDLIADPNRNRHGADAIVQWLELMPSKDWMCRSELLLPRLRELLSDPRFELRPRTAQALIAELQSQSASSPPTRNYTMDQVWHGMTLGKNADAHPRSSRLCESQLIQAEATSALASLFGRPYPNWDVYPTWELEECWRHMLAAQHHDNHECEGLCGGIGDLSFDYVEKAAPKILEHAMHTIADRISIPGEAIIAFNGSAQPRDLFITASEGLPPILVKDVPPFGYSAIQPSSGKRPVERITITHDRGQLTLSRGSLKLTIDKRRGVITQIYSTDFPQGALAAPLAELSMLCDGREDKFEHTDVEIADLGGQPVVCITRQGRDERQITIEIRLDALREAIDLVFIADALPQPDAGMHAGLQTRVSPSFRLAPIIADHPCAASAITAPGEFKRKYPTGDWMTSPQTFETIRRPFTAQNWLDLVDESSGRGLLCFHDGGQQFFHEGTAVSNLLSAYDPWDEDRFNPRLRARLLLTPHGPLSDGARARIAAGMTGNWSISGTEGQKGDIPAKFGCLAIENAPNVLAHAFFRESMKSGENLPLWAGHRMFKESDGACDHPFVIRLTEWNGDPAEVALKLPGPIALAAKTNIMGEVGGPDTRWLDIEHPVEPPAWSTDAKLKGEPITWSALRFTMRPREVATIYADLLMGRKQWRDLDAKRKVWATVHKTT